MPTTATEEARGGDSGGTEDELREMLEREQHEHASTKAELERARAALAARTSGDTVNEDGDSSRTRR